MTDDPSGAGRAVGKRTFDRLVALGASRYPWRYGPDADYVVLEDPDGNLFCVVGVSEQYG